MRVQFGALLNQELIARAGEVEALGYESLWASEHMLFHAPRFEAISQMGVIAGRTKRALIGSAVFLLPLRHPTTVAKSFSSLDILSDGRIVAGVGVGGEYPKEFEACGVPVNERGPRTNEAIDILRRLWSEDHVTHDGRFFHLDDVTMEPKPVQVGGPPIVVGGRSEAAQRRAVAKGDGYMPYLFTPKHYRDGVARIESIAAERGRSLQDFQWYLYQSISLADSYEAALAQARQRMPDYEDRIIERYCILGTAEECAARLTEYVEAGARHFILVPSAPPSERFDHLVAYQEKVLPLVNAAIAAN